MTPRPVLRIFSSVAPRIHTPGLVHLDDGIHALARRRARWPPLSAETGTGLPSRAITLNLWPAKRDAAVLDRAGVEQVHQDALALLDADGLPGTQ